MSSTRLGNYTVSYHNSEEYHHLKSEIFNDDIYFFDSDNPQPRIIDAGAHIGLATLYCKKLFPGAIVTAIEPNPTLFKLLEENVWQNDLSNVTCVQAALTGDPAQTSVILHRDETNEWLMSTSKHAGAWSGEQATVPFQAAARSLREFLVGEPIDLLKMDIEGAELGVLRAAADLLPSVRQIIMEYHSITDQPLQPMLDLLKPHFDKISVTKRQLPVSDPKHFRGLCMINATR